ncbi:MAG: YqfO family protein, partial [Chitinophagaceae bacterium]
AHHPIIFTGLKKITGSDYVQRTILSAIKKDIAIYAIHTSLDNVSTGVNSTLADKLELNHRSVLYPKTGTLSKLYTFVPLKQAEAVRNALFQAGGGSIGNYSECSFNVEGIGTYTAQQGANPFLGKVGTPHQEPEVKMEMVFSTYLKEAIVKALMAAHPYEEVAYDLVELSNPHVGHGAGLLGQLSEPCTEKDFLERLKALFGCKVIRHTALSRRNIKVVAVCGGAGSYLISSALKKNADAFVTADLKYHEFFNAENRLLVCDIGHYESEQFTADLLANRLRQKFTTFAVLKSEQQTNPVYYS